MKLFIALAIAITTAACVDTPAGEPGTTVDPADREAYTLEQSVSVLADEPLDGQLERSTWCDGNTCCVREKDVNIYCCFFYEGATLCV